MEVALKARSCRTPRQALCVKMIRLTKEPKIAPIAGVTRTTIAGTQIIAMEEFNNG
jgi:hypothetical protein